MPASPSDPTTGKPRYEPVDVVHSWNADARVSNAILFKLQRHSDHHAHASRRYQILRSFAHSPQMPTGYAGMMAMALVPPVWFWVMNPRVDAYRQERARMRKASGDSSQAQAAAARLGGQAAQGVTDSQSAA